MLPFILNPLPSHARTLRKAPVVCAQTPEAQVFLAGTGPGDCLLLTQAVTSLIPHVDVIIHDRLIPPFSAPPSTELICVGKGRQFGSTQLEINELLLQNAKSGRKVLRLKGGDPSIFGRLGSEVQYLRKHDVSVHVVPGVTTASAVAAALQFPLTHPDIGEGVLFVTAHKAIEWMPRGMLKRITVVLYMGLKELPRVIQLWEADVAVVAVQSVGLAGERFVFGTTGSIVQRVRGAGLQSPTLIVIGDVVRLAKGWNEEEADR